MKSLHGVLVLSLFLSGCGGGGGGSSSQAVSAEAPLLPTVSTDIVPSGARIDVTGKDYFSALNNHGNTWVFSKQVNGSTVGTVTRTTQASTGVCGSSVRDVDSTDPSNPDFTEYMKTAAAEWVMCDPTGAYGEFPGVYDALKQFTLYTTPFYPVGAVRQSVRQGSMKADIDKDGKEDYFALYITQVFQGFSNVQVMGTMLETARFTNTVLLKVVPSSTKVAMYLRVEDVVSLAPGLGEVRIDRNESSWTDASAGAGPSSYALVLKNATISGTFYGTP